MKLKILTVGTAGSFGRGNYSRNACGMPDEMKWALQLCSWNAYLHGQFFQWPTQILHLRQVVGPGAVSYDPFDSAQGT
jgi:hypothetical protein